MDLTNQDLTLKINGETHSFPAPATLGTVIRQLGMKPDRIAVEHNGEIVPRAQWNEAAIHSGDRLEIVHFVGGGSPSAAG